MTDSSATNLAVDTALSEALFEVKYGATRRSMLRTYRWRLTTRSLDATLSRIEDVLVGAANAPLPEEPIFITGSFRSGTTMLERILASHSKVAYFDHLSFPFPRAPLAAGLLRKVMGESRAAPAPHQPNLRMDSSWPSEGEHLWRFCRANPWNSQSPDVLGPDFSDPSFERLLCRTIHKTLRRERASRFISKSPLHTLRAGYLARLFPSARFIHVIRHPQRVLRSQVDLQRMWARLLGTGPWNSAFSDTFLPPGRLFPRTTHADTIEALRLEDPELAIAWHLVDMQAAFEQAVDDGGFRDRVCVIRYEDFLADFDREAARVIEHVGLDDAEGEALIRASSTGFVDRGLVSNKSPLPEVEERVLKVLAPLMEAYTQAR